MYSTRTHDQFPINSQPFGEKVGGFCAANVYFGDEMKLSAENWCEVFAYLSYDANHVPAGLNNIFSMDNGKLRFADRCCFHAFICSLCLLLTNTVNF